MVAGRLSKLPRHQTVENHHFLTGDRLETAPRLLSTTLPSIAIENPSIPIGFVHPRGRFHAPVHKSSVFCLFMEAGSARSALLIGRERQPGEQSFQSTESDSWNLVTLQQLWRSICINISGLRRPRVVSENVDTCLLWGCIHIRTVHPHFASHLTTFGADPIPGEMWSLLGQLWRSICIHIPRPRRPKVSQKMWIHVLYRDVSTFGRCIHI